ncbi:hypothetical protein SALBM311S_03483 [Streptomyces alboniger]
MLAVAADLEGDIRVVEFLVQYVLYGVGASLGQYVAVSGGPRSSVKPNARIRVAF